MADKKVILEVELIEGNANSKLNELKASLQSLDKTHKDYKPTLELVAQAERDLAKAQQNRILVEKGLAGSTVKVEKATKKTAKQMKQLSSDTGASTSATLELGRVFSDAPYGIRGVANNIQQLASNLFFMSKKTNEATGKTVGFKGAVGSLLKNLIGPAGILVAFQAGIALLDYFSGGAKKAEKGTNDFNDSVSKSGSNLKILKQSLKDGTLSTEEANRAVEKANKQYKGLNLKLDENNKLTEESVGFIEDKINSIERLAKAQAIQSLIETQYSVIAKARHELDAELSQRGLNLKDLEIRKEEERLALEGKTGAERRKIQRDFLTQNEKIATGIVSSFKKIEDKGNEAISSLLAQLGQGDLVDELFKDNKSTGGSKSKGTIKLLDPKDFEGDLFEIEKMLRKFKHKELTLAAETEQQKGAVKALIELDNFKKEYSSYVESEDQKFDKFKENLEKETSAHKANLDKQLKAKKITQEEFNKAASDGQEARDTALAFAEEEFRDKSLVSYENYLKGLVAISDKYDRDIIGVGVTQFDTLAEQQRKAADRVLTGKLNVFQNQAESAKKILSSMTDFVNGEFDREMTIEQNKTNALNTELNNRLNNENLSKEQRRSIQNEIAQNDEKLRVKQEVIERKRFKMNKAANIANALMDTASAAAGVMAQAKGGFFARLAQAIPTIAFGLAQVATIARQKFQSSASKTPINTTGGGGSGSGEGRAEPSFNIVGRSDDNLLINAIQATFDKPLKAYVVSRDVTNQQQLDGIITDQAGT